MIIAVDFDGTLVDHRYPDIGAEVPGAFNCLRECQQAGAKLILWTMRSDSNKDGPTLTAAVDYCRERGVTFYGVNQNPTQREWTNSPKAYAHLYVDDAAIGCPLRENPRAGGRPIADWERIAPMVLALARFTSNSENVAAVAAVKPCPVCDGNGSVIDYMAADQPRVDCPHCTTA